MSDEIITRQEEIKEYLEKGAVILDVRTQIEWNEGHTEGASHIVLNTIPAELEQIKSWNKLLQHALPIPSSGSSTQRRVSLRIGC